MLNILKSELFKLTRNKAVKIVLILAACFALFGMLLMLALSFLLKTALGQPIFNGNTSFLLAMSTDGQALLIMLSAVITSVIVTDHRRGILRNMMVSGYCRTRIYLSKLIIAAIVGAVLCLISTTVYFLGGTIFFGIESMNAGRVILQYLLLLLTFCAFSSIATLVAFLTKNTGATIGISIALLFLFAIVATVSTFLELTEGNEILKNVTKIVGELYVGNLLPSVVNFDEKVSKLVQYFITAVVTLCGTTALGIFTFNKADMK